MLSVFPAGWAGIGLLLLRTGAGVAIVLQGVHRLAGPAATPWMLAGGLLAVATGAGLLVGFMTPIAGFLGAAGSIGIVALGLGAPAAALVAVMSMAIVLLGPGAYSIDGLRFGRRELVIPTGRERDHED